MTHLLLAFLLTCGVSLRTFSITVTWVTSQIHYLAPIPCLRVCFGADPNPGSDSFLRLWPWLWSWAGGQAGWHGPIPAYFGPEATLPSSSTACCHGALVPRMPRQMEKRPPASGSLSLQNAPGSARSFCQLHSVPNSDAVLQGVSGVRGSICCPNRPVTPRQGRRCLLRRFCHPELRGCSIWCSPPHPRSPPLSPGPAVQGFDRDPQEDTSQRSGREAWDLGMSPPTWTVG